MCVCVRGPPGLQSGVWGALLPSLACAGSSLGWGGGGALPGLAYAGSSLGWWGGSYLAWRVQAPVYPGHELCMVLDRLYRCLLVQVPDPHCHVIGGGEHHVTLVRRALDAAHGVLVAGQLADGLAGLPQVPHPHHPVSTPAHQNILVIIQQ